MQLMLFDKSIKVSNDRGLTLTFFSKALRNTFVNTADHFRQVSVSKPKNLMLTNNLWAH